MLDLKRPFCFVVFFLNPEKNLDVFIQPGRAYEEPQCTGMASGKGTSLRVCTVSVALDPLDLSWQISEQKVKEVM